MSLYLQQGTLNFTSGYKLQTQWGLQEALVFSLETAGALTVALAGHSKAGFITGLVIVVAAAILLLGHLGHPAQAWRAMFNVRTSWLSRGALALGALIVCALWSLGLSWNALGPAPADGLQSFLQWVLLALGLFIGLYPGLILSASPAIPFWRSALLPVLSLLQGAASALLLLLPFLAAAGSMTAEALWVPVWVLVLLGVTLALHVARMLRRGGGGAESARYLLQGQRLQFIGAACGIGIVLPLVLLLLAAVSGGGAPLFVAAAIARLAGDVALRHAFLKVAMFEPVI